MAVLHPNAPLGRLEVVHEINLTSRKYLWRCYASFHQGKPYNQETSHHG